MRWITLLVLSLLLLIPNTSPAQNAADDEPFGPPVESGDEAEPAAPATQPTAPSTRAPDQDALIDDLLGGDRPVPRLTAPATRPALRNVPTRIGAPADRVDLDPAVLGVAPGGKAPALLREGEFMINRAGRLIRSSDGALSLFVFEADDTDSPERPMILQPCQMLQAMEDLAARRGGDMVFVLSGQVHTYRGNNYLLPTRMKTQVDKGNLMPQN